MLSEQIDQDLKIALKEKSEIAVSALRNLKAALKNAEIEKGGALSDDEVLKVMAKKVKQHKDSIDSFVAGNRTDLAEHETGQMHLLEKYLPKQMSEDEVKALTLSVITEMKATAADFGKVMKEVLSKAAGRTDGSVVSKIVKENLK